MRISVAFGMAIAAAALVGPAHATLSISSAPTQNVNCRRAHCEATAAQAVLNVKELRHLFANNPRISVSAGMAKDIAIAVPLTLTHTDIGPPTIISFASTGAIRVNKRTSLATAATLSIRSRALTFAPKASLDFWDFSGSQLTINGDAYALIGDYQTLCVSNAKFIALARDIDDHYAHRYQMDPNAAGYVFDGLGHTLSNLDLTDGNSGIIDTNFGTIRNLKLENARVSLGTDASGLVAGYNKGVIDHVSVSGTLNTTHDTGGLAGFNDGVITNSRARVKITAQGMFNGGLAGRNYGTIASSHAEGEIGGAYMDTGWGGLVGLNAKRGKIRNSYSLVRIRKIMYEAARYGGLIGWSAKNSSIENSYAAGEIESARRSGGLPGGVVGYVEDFPAFLNTYWDLDKGVQNPHQGAGSNRDQPGLTGLTDAQLKSGLPAGFDPTVWGQNPNINSGYPYLLSNPPQ